MTEEIFLTSHEARSGLYSASGWQNAWKNGDVPAPVIIGGKHLWPKSRIDAFKQEIVEKAAQREAAIKAADSPEARRVAALASSPEAQQARRLADSTEAKFARNARAPRVR